MTTETLPFKVSKKTALFPFAALCLAVIVSYALLKNEIVNRPPLEHLDTSQRPASPMEGKKAPSFTLKNLNGETVRLKDHLGKILFINIWATWCEPCREEMPAMEKLYNTLKGKDFEMLAISIDKDGEKSVRPYVKELGLTFPVLLDPKNRVSKKYKTTGVPETFIVNRNGTIVYHQLGPENWASPEMIETFKEMMFGQKNDAGTS